MSRIGGSNAPLRPVAILREYGRRYPDAWRQVDRFRLQRGAEVPAWPEWCYVPIAATLAIVDAGRPGADRLAVAHDAAVLAALAAWRIGQGIYRWDPTLASAVVATPIDGALPTDLLFRLPEWGVYHAIPPGLLAVAGTPVVGVFAHLEWDAPTGGAELRFAFDGGADQLFAVPILLTAPTLREALDALVTSAATRASGPVRHPGDAALPLLSAALALTLYLCAEDADMAGPGQPGNPEPVATSRGPRIFPRERVRTWDVGWRVGAALRHGAEAHPANPQGASGPHAPPRPHLRRAHWHTYWVGPRHAAQTRRLRWLHPVLVGGDGERPAVIHPVDGAPSR